MQTRFGAMTSTKLSASGVVEAEGVSLDGATDYLNKTTALTGAIDSKTATIGVWFYVVDNGASQYILDTSDTNMRLYLNQANNRIDFQTSNGSGTKILDVELDNQIIYNQWNYLLLSFDLANVSNRWARLNDILLIPIWNDYIDDTVDFTQINWAIGATTSGTLGVEGRLYGYFTDLIYRVDTEANRRLFINADGTPADWDTTKALNGILMLQMKDAATCHINDGYGGNMVQNGLIETADRGANQDNCVASEFDGSSQYLSLAGNAGASSSKLTTVSVNFNDYNTSLDNVFRFYDGAYGTILEVRTFATSIEITGGATTGVNLKAEIAEAMSSDRLYSLQFSVDMANSANRYVIVNGVDVTSEVTWTTYTDNAFHYDVLDNMFIGRDHSANYFEGSIGELYFDPVLIDLATSNPFWDSDTNKPIPVRTAMINLGSNPLIVLPISADNPGKNYGSASDWVLNGGGLTGAKGASEAIGRAIVSDASNKVTHAGIFCKSLVKWINNVVSYHNDVTVIESDVGTVGYYFGFSDTIDWNLEASRNLVTNQLGDVREPSKVISDSGFTPVLGLFFEDTLNFGLNSYGADFSTTGSPTAGADINV